MAQFVVVLDATIVTTALPVTATVIGIIVLGQIPGARGVVGILLVVAGVALHQERAAAGQHS